MTLLDDLISAGRVLLAHAHPDDESISTGALALVLADRGVDVGVLTATRGERGEQVPGSLPPGVGIDEHRARELALAVERLGVRRHAYLGTPPAAAGEPRRYRDSGMVWVREGLAGPAGDAGADAFSRAPLADITTDLTALLAAWRPRVLVTYDADGGYGHPDHVRLHEVAKVVCRGAGVRLVAVTTDRARAQEWYERPDLLPRLRRVLDAHRTQVTVEGDRLVHVGGQEQPIETWFGLLKVPTADAG